MPESPSDVSGIYLSITSWELSELCRALICPSRGASFRYQRAVKSEITNSLQDAGLLVLFEFFLGI